MEVRSRIKNSHVKCAYFHFNDTINKKREVYFSTNLLRAHCPLQNTEGKWRVVLEAIIFLFNFHLIVSNGWMCVKFGVVGIQEGCVHEGCNLIMEGAISRLYIR